MCYYSHRLSNKRNRGPDRNTPPHHSFSSFNLNLNNMSAVTSDNITSGGVFTITNGNTSTPLTYNSGTRESKAVFLGVAIDHSRLIVLIFLIVQADLTTTLVSSIESRRFRWWRRLTNFFFFFFFFFRSGQRHRIAMASGCSIPPIQWPIPVFSWELMTLFLVLEVYSSMFRILSYLTFGQLAQLSKTW